MEENLEKQEEEKLLEEIGDLEQDLQVQNSMGPNTMLSPMSLRQHTHRHLNDNAKVAIEDAPQNEEKKKGQPD